jgi:predicted transposase YdaD
MSFDYDRLKEIARAREEAKLNEWWALGAAKQIGREEGILFVARNFLALGTPIDTIMKATGLSVKDIQNLSAQT